MSLKELREKFPWPQSQPDGTEHHWGWISSAGKKAMLKILKTTADVRAKGGTVLELGTLYGKSARWWLRMGFDHVICNDLFQYKHSPEGTHYRDFLHSNWDMREQFTVIKMVSQAALTTVRSFDVDVSVIYIDACHKFGEAAADIILAYQLFYPNTLIIGDDWHFPSVADAVRFTADKLGFTFQTVHKSWYIEPPK